MRYNIPEKQRVVDLVEAAQLYEQEEAAGLRDQV